MPGPWEKYQDTEEDQSNGLPGPWSKYQSADPGVAPVNTPGLLDEEGGLSYLAYKAARSVPIYGEAAAKAIDYGTAAFDPNRDVDQVTKDREAKEAEWAAQNPRINTSGAIGGSFANPLPFLGYGAKAYQLTSKTTPLLERALVGGAESAGVATREGLVAGTDAAMRGNDPKDPTLTAAEVAGGVTAGGKVLSKFIPKYVLGINDPETTARKYIERRPEINAADEEKLFHQVTDASDEIGRKNAHADELARTADDEYRGAREALRAELQGTRPPETLSTSVVEAVDKLGKRVSEGSSKAFDVLAQSNVEIPLPKIKAFLTLKMNRYKFNGTSFPGADQDLAVLSQWRKWFDDIGDKTARPEQMKDIVKYLDDQSRQIWAKPRGQRTMAENDLLEFRQYIDSTLKNDVAGYREAMAPVADDMKVLSIARKMFSDERRADKALQRVGKPFNERDFRVLQELSNRTGTDLVGPMQEYMSAQRSLRGPSFAQKAEMLPEYANSQRLRAERDALAERTAFHTKFSRDRAQKALKGLRSKSQDPIALREDLEALSKESGIDFVQMNDDLAMKEMFEKGFTHGSRNVNLGAFTGQAIASALFKAGKEIPAIGPFIGALGGSVVDRSGPMLYKWALDASQNKMLRKFAVPVLHTIERSPQIAQRMIQEEMKQNPELRISIDSHIMGQKFSQKYAAILNDAAKRGPEKLSLTMALIAKKDPEYAPFLQQLTEGANLDEDN